MVYKFAEIVKQPAAPKVAVNYALTPYNGGAGAWTVAEKSASTAISANIGKYIVAPTTDNKTASGGWGQIHSISGAPVGETVPGAKPGSKTYLLKIAPSVEGLGTDGAKYTPASKAVKLKVSDQIKPPSLKPDYKKETINTKADTYIVFGDRAVIKNTSGKLSAENGAYAAAFGRYVLTSKDEAKSSKTVSLANVLTASENIISVFTAPTAKKPASYVVTIKLAPRAAAPAAQVIVAANGKVTGPKTLEFYLTASKKYGSLPKVTATTTVTAADGGVRVKATAKADKNGGYTGLAASLPSQYKIDYGAYLASNGKTEKSGVLSLDIANSASVAGE
jgi:hypothetical protein